MFKRILITASLLMLFGSETFAVTHYVAQPGANVTGDWLNHWTTVDQVNSGTQAGDTVLFGTGTWRGTILYPEAGSFDGRTVYACSSWTYTNPLSEFYIPLAEDVNSSGEEFYARLYGSDLISGFNNWSLVSGNVYRRSWSATETYQSLFQGEQLLIRQDSPSLSEGEWYYGGGELQVYIYGGGDPDNVELEMARRVAVAFTHGDRPDVGASYVTLYGLSFRYGLERLITQSYSDYSQPLFDSVFIDHCYVSHVAGKGDGNPALIYSGQYDVPGEYNRVRGCSLGYVWSINPATMQPYNGSSWGSATCFYAQRNMTVDSNYVFGYFDNSGIYFKGGYGQPWKDNNVIAFNNITCGATGIRIYSEMRYTEIYGNTFNGPRTGVQFEWGRPATPASGDGQGLARVFNNTFVNCLNPLEHFNVEAGGWDTRGMPRGDVFKYNVIYSSGSSNMYIDSMVTNGGIFLDDNLYDVAGTLTLRQHPLLWYGAGSDGYKTITQWQSIGLDINSDFNSPHGFADLANDNFRREPGDMDTTYGGRHWSAWGAVQTDATTPEIGVTVSGGVLKFAAVDGLSSAVDQTFQIYNAGINTLNWNVTDDAGWLTITPTSGTGTTTLTASVATQSIGSYTAEITITAAGAANSPRTIAVNYDIVEPDITPPIITFGNDSSLATSFSNNITWLTDEPATSRVEYGYTAAYGEMVESQVYATFHSVWLTDLTSDTVYHFQVISVDTAGNEAVSFDSTFRTPVQPDNLALNGVITVNGTYSGYSSSVINDSIIDATGGTSSTWASTESVDHWVEIDLQQSAPVSSIRIYWAFNNGNSTWMRSQLFTIQGWDGSAWLDLATVDNVVNEIITYPDTVITYADDGTPDGFSVTLSPPGDDLTISEAGFDTITISKLRISQAGNMGPVSYPTIMWITEVEVFADDITPPTSKL